MSDIVERLRKGIEWTGPTQDDTGQTENLMDEAADEIERLREWNREIALNAREFVAENERLRAALDGAYNERNRLVAFVARLFPSGLKKTAIPGWDEAWHGCVYIDLPTGQASWHFHDREAHLFDGLPPYSGEWDGHSTDEKYERIARAALEEKP